MYCLEVQRARLLEEIMSIKNLFQQESESVTEQPVKIPFDFTNRDSIPKGKDPGDCIVIKPITVRTWFRIRPLLLEIEKEDIDKMIVKDGELNADFPELMNKYEDYFSMSFAWAFITSQVIRRHGLKTPSLTIRHGRIYAYYSMQSYIA